VSRRVVLVLAVLGGCEGALDVEVSTAVGARSHREDARASVQDVRTVAETLLARSDPRAKPGVDAIAQPVHPPAEGSELDELVVAIRKGPLDELGGPARRIAAAPRSLWPELRLALLAPRRAPKGDYRSMLRAIGGDVPNRYGYFELSWKKAHGHAIKLSEDWLEDLLALPRSKLSPMLIPVYRDCVLQSAMLRAAGSIGRDPRLVDDVITTLLDAAYVHEGTFRDEVGRAIQAVGDDAVPPLMLAAIPPVDTRDELALRRAEYAVHQLDRMDRWVPERAEAALRSDPRRLAGLLRAWGTARTGEAAPMILLHVDARIPTVREAARWAFSQLVDGPLPKTISRNVRLLGGGTGRAQAFLNHRQHAGVAVRDAIARANPELLEAWCGPPEPGLPLDPQCEDQPARHTHAYFAWLDARRAQDEAATIDAAIAERDPEAAIERLDRLLAEQPELAAPERLADVYRQGAAVALGRGDAERAAALSRKAAVLVEADAPELAETLRVQALLAEAGMPGLPPWGRDMLLRTAERMRPGDPHVERARAAIPELALDSGAASSHRTAFGASVVLAAFGCLGGIGAGLRRRRAAPRI
jgi:hypothetical protein